MAQDQLRAAPWAPQEDARRTAKFMTYALTAAAEASAGTWGNSPLPGFNRLLALLLWAPWRQCRNAEGLSAAHGTKCTCEMFLGWRLISRCCGAAAALLQALQDAGWVPDSDEKRRATGVALGAGMSCTTDMAEAGVLLVRGAGRASAGWLGFCQAPALWCSVALCVCCTEVRQCSAASTILPPSDGPPSYPHLQMHAESTCPPPPPVPSLDQWN